MSYNNPSHRGGAFVLGMLFMVALWAKLGMAVFAQI